MTNALFNDNRLKLGVFGLNVSNGCAATTAEGHLQPTWQNNLDIAVMADRAGVEALVPVASLRASGAQSQPGTGRDGPGRRAGGVAYPGWGRLTSSSTPRPDCGSLKHATTIEPRWGRMTGVVTRLSSPTGGRRPARHGAGGPAPAVCPSRCTLISTRAEACGNVDHRRKWPPPRVSKRVSVGNSPPKVARAAVPYRP